jgi:hypothetical protein
MGNLISPCCGANYTDYEYQGSTCCGAQISESGICYKCRDHADLEEGYTCSNCEEFFDHPEKDYEYAERMHDSYLEDRMDEEKLGL